MKIVITGSIAYDYLMSFPGRFRDAFVVDKLEKISLSFLVDSLRRQRGGTAPNIAYTMALLGDRPTIMATAGQDFAEYRAWLEEQGVDTSAILEIDGEFCASFFVNTDEDHNQIASFYTGLWPTPQASLRRLCPDADLPSLPQRPRRHARLRRRCKALGLPTSMTPASRRCA
jgi:adenosine kinase